MKILPFLPKKKPVEISFVIGMGANVSGISTKIK